MAYVSQEKKAKVQAELKKVIPSTWKWSLAVEHHSTIRLTIAAGPQELTVSPRNGETSLHRNLNTYYLDTEFPKNPELQETFKKISTAMNTDNFDNSDIMTDYFHVGHYVSIQIGKWDKPFIIR
jgi:hypothetical protein